MDSPCLAPLPRVKPHQFTFTCRSSSAPDGLPQRRTRTLHAMSQFDAQLQLNKWLTRRGLAFHFLLEVQVLDAKRIPG